MNTEEFEQTEALTLQELREKLARAETDITAGHSMDADKFFNQLMKEFDDDCC